MLHYFSLLFLTTTLWLRYGLFCQWGVGSSEKLSKLPIITQLRSDKAKIYRIRLQNLNVSANLLDWVRWQVTYPLSASVPPPRIEIPSDFPCRILWQLKVLLDRKVLFNPKGLCGGNVLELLISLIKWMFWRIRIFYIEKMQPVCLYDAPMSLGKNRKKDWKVYCCMFSILQCALTMPSILHAFLILVKIYIHTYMYIYTHISYIRIHISYIFNSQTNPMRSLIYLFYGFHSFDKYLLSIVSVFRFPFIGSEKINPNWFVHKENLFYHEEVWQ